MGLSCRRPLSKSTSGHISTTPSLESSGRCPSRSSNWGIILISLLLESSGQPHYCSYCSVLTSTNLSRESSGRRTSSSSNSGIILTSPLLGSCSRPPCRSHCLVFISTNQLLVSCGRLH
ncbi:unnamed protein product [Ectocarpus sp. 12 AP-2014]